MKILHIIDSSGMYGAEIMLLNLMEEQKAIGLTPILLSLGNVAEGDKRIEEEGEKRGLLVKKLRISKSFGLISSIKKLIYFAEDVGIDLFHSHGYKGNILLGVVPKGIRKFPVVSTLHGWTATKRLSKIWLYEKLDQFFLRKFDALVLVTEGRYGERTTIKFNDNRANKIFVIENGIPILSFDTDSNISNRLWSKKNSFIIGSIGRLSQEKGFEYLINALAFLKAKSNDYKLVILGEGKQREYLENIIREKGLNERVFLIGYHENGYKLIKNFNVFALSSLTEGLPITLLEAMQAGVPIIATRVGGIPGVINNGQSGLLVEPKDAISLANAILFIRKNSDKAKSMARNAKHIALTKYSSRRMAEKYRAVYQKVLTNY
jgi:glycosyltransferase involved in cell wall biosynthesis